MLCIRSPVFMRVTRTLPPFTLRLSALFVNGKSPISTGFLLKLPGFPGFCPYLGNFSAKTALLRALVQAKQNLTLRSIARC